MLAHKSACLSGTASTTHSTGQRLASCRPCGAAWRPASVVQPRQPLRLRCRATQDDVQKDDEGPSSSFPLNLEIPTGPDRPLTLREQLALEQEQEGLQQQQQQQGETALQLSTSNQEDEDEFDGSRSSIEQFMFPDKEELPDDIQMPVWDHLEELRERVLIALLAAGAAILGCFCFSKELVVFLEAPVADAGVRFLQLSPGEFFFTTFKVAGYSGLLLSAPTVLYEVIAYVLPGLTKSERTFLAPLVFGSSILFYAGLVFSYEILTPAALNFFVSYAEGAVESLWSIDQYFQFVLVLMLSTGLSFQVPVIQVMLGQLRVVSSEQMFSQWRYVVVGATVVAAVLTPSTDPFTQTLLALPLIGLYFGGAAAVRFLEGTRVAQASA